VRKIKARLENIMTQLLAKRRAQKSAGKVCRPRTDQKGKTRLLEKNKFSGDTFMLAEPKRQP